MVKWTEVETEHLITFWEEHCKLSKVNKNIVLDLIRKSLAKNLNDVNKLVKAIRFKMDCFFFKYLMNASCYGVRVEQK
jgi:hypothetical protein